MPRADPYTGQPRPVRSSQTDLHPRLEALVRRHLSGHSRQPSTPYGLAAWAQIQAWATQAGQGLMHHAKHTPCAPAGGPARLILDSGCGTGQSTVTLARRHPHAVVIGIDQSAHRLDRNPCLGTAHWPANALLVRAEAAELWQLMAEHGWRAWRHCLLYPNPWPKPGHVQRRWHGHGHWPALLHLGGRLELRTNWDIYAREFAHALNLSGHAAQAHGWAPPTPISPFERKYERAGHPLWRVCVDLGASAAQPLLGQAQAGKIPVDR